MRGNFPLPTVHLRGMLTVVSFHLRRKKNKIFKATSRFVTVTSASVNNPRAAQPLQLLPPPKKIHCDHQLVDHRFRLATHHVVVPNYLQFIPNIFGYFPIFHILKKKKIIFHKFSHFQFFTNFHIFFPIFPIFTNFLAIFKLFPISNFFKMYKFFPLFHRFFNFSLIFQFLSNFSIFVQFFNF